MYVKEGGKWVYVRMEGGSACKREEGSLREREGER